MIMQTCQSKDQFGVNYNWDYILLQVREVSDDFEEARIKLAPDDVDSLIDMLNYYKERVLLWKAAVGPRKQDESENDYNLRILTTAKENNYFIGKQEE